MNYIKNCGDTATNVIKVRENSTIDMTSNCEIVPNACGETIGFKSAHVTYQVWKNNMPILRNELDACDAITKVNADIRTMLKVFGLPNKCPVEKVKPLFHFLNKFCATLFLRCQNAKTDQTKVTWKVSKNS